MAEEFLKRYGTGYYTGSLKNASGDKEIRINICPANWGGYHVECRVYTNLDKPYWNHKVPVEADDEFKGIAAAKKFALDFLAKNKKFLGKSIKASFKNSGLVRWIES